MTRQAGAALLIGLLSFQTLAWGDTCQVLFDQSKWLAAYDVDPFDISTDLLPGTEYTGRILGVPEIEGAYDVPFLLEVKGRQNIQARFDATSIRPMTDLDSRSKLLSQMEDPHFLKIFGMKPRTAQGLWRPAVLLGQLDFVHSLSPYTIPSPSLHEAYLIEETLSEKIVGVITLQSFDHSKTYWLSLGIFDQYRQLGHGRRAIKAMLSAIRQRYDGYQVAAQVRESNKASMNAFTSADFELNKTVAPLSEGLKVYTHPYVSHWPPKNP